MTDRLLRALVVEDEHLLAVSLADALRRIGLEVGGIANAQTDAIALLDAERFDIAFIDLFLGREYHGLDLARSASARGIAAVLVTGHLSDAISGTLASLPSAAPLTNPFPIDQPPPALPAPRPLTPSPP